MKKSQNTSRQLLPKSYKHAYPFRIASPSFIYPDGYAENVRMLGPYLDEIELLMFEGSTESLPSKQEIKTLARLAEAFDLKYNVHLPTDMSLTDPDDSKSRQAAEAVCRVMELAAPLSPSTHTLHLPYKEISREKSEVRRWQDRSRKNLEYLLSFGIKSESISVETLDYPFEWVEKIISDLGFTVCVDIGHLMRYGFPVARILDRYFHRTSIIHFHGVNTEKRDHIALNHISNHHMEPVMQKLQQFAHTVSLEVFSFSDLNDSLMFLEKCWKRGKDRKT